MDPNPFGGLDDELRQRRKNPGSQQGVENVCVAHGTVGMDHVVRHHPKLTGGLPPVEDGVVQHPQDVG